MTRQDAVRKSNDVDMDPSILGLLFGCRLSARFHSCPMSSFAVPASSLSFAFTVRTAKLKLFVRTVFSVVAALLIVVDMRLDHEGLDPAQGALFEKQTLLTPSTWLAWPRNTGDNYEFVFGEAFADMIMFEAVW